MRYYLYTPSCAVASIGAPSAEHKRIVRIHYQDVPLASSWQPLAFHGFKEEKSMPQEGDFPALNDFCRIPVFSQRAWDVLRAAVDCRWEALPIIHPCGKQYYLIHVMETIDCVDVERSEGVQLFDDGRVMEIERYCLKTEVLAGKHVFKTPVATGAELFVDDVFREAVEKNGLKGLEFRPLPMVREGRTQTS